MHFKKQSKINFSKTILGFTLVELIVVITILAILGTIAYMSLQGYSTQARDSTRISDMGTMKSSLELYQVDTGKYPNPTAGVNITYSGGLVWTQGTFGETVFSNLSKIDKIPTDPLTEKQYTYSVTSTKTEYQLGGILEGDYLSMNNEQSIMNNSLVSHLNAGEKIALAFTTGNFNGRVVVVNSGATCNVLAIPSIITNDETITDIQQIATNKSFVFRGYKNLPSSFTGSKFKQDGGFAFEPNFISVYTDTGSCDPLINKTDYTARIGLLNKLQLAYTGTILQTEGEIKNILDLVIDELYPNLEVIDFAGNLVNNGLGANIPLNNNPAGLTGWMWLDKNCKIPDINIGTQTWAGCNSTLGLGLEWGILANGGTGTVTACYNYEGNSTGDCTIGSSYMSSNSDANNWYVGTNSNGDTEYNNIWGKLYSWENTSSACPKGWHVPTDNDFLILEESLGCLDFNVGGWRCAGFGWSLHNTQTESNNFTNALKIPLSGYFDTDGVSLDGRGFSTYLWTSDPFNITNSIARGFYRIQPSVFRNIWNKDYSFSVRCLMD